MKHPTDALSVRCYGASHGSHAHEHFQILLGLDGVLDLEVDGRGQRIAAGNGAATMLTACLLVPRPGHPDALRSGAQPLVLSFSQAAITSAAYISAGPPPMYTHTASISSSSGRVQPSWTSALT